MNTQNLVHEAAEKFEGASSNNPLLGMISARVLGLLTESIEQCKVQPKDIERLVTLNDEDLLTEVVIKLSSKRATVTERELRKQEKRIKAKQSFLSKLAEFGGTYKAGEVAKMLDLTRQTINNQRLNGTLLSLKDGNDYIYPAFQFYKEEKIEGFEEILKNLKNVDPVTKCTFFLNKMNILNYEISPLDLLKNKPDREILNELKQKSALFGVHSAK